MIMKHIFKYLMLGAVALLTHACNNESESDLLEPKVYFENKTQMLSIEGETMNVELSARLTTMSDSPVEVTYAIADKSVVDEYNAKYGTSYEMFDASHASLSSTSSTIASGDIYSEIISVELSNLSTVEEGKSFILPVKVQSNSVPTLPGTDMVFFFISKPVKITTVAKFNSNYIKVPFPAGTYFNSFTYEALVYISRFGSNNTIMGTEGIMILRIGDAGGGVTPEDIIEVAGQQTYKVSDPVQTGKWYHIALTYDQPSGKSAIYVNGSKWAETGWAIPGFDPNADVGFNIGKIPGFQWGERPLYGYMSEVRVWSVARTETQLKQNMLTVDPKSPGLELYFKLNGTDALAGGYITDCAKGLECTTNLSTFEELETPVKIE
jgi:hypothetical protein